ncbi:HNH endonuclease family protein, partial [Patescibacteria group bacterium]|nr:HNH endonuclease family protein [Patescibacteria group bacterium]
IFKKFKNDKVKLNRIGNMWSDIENVFADSRNLFKTFLRHQWISGGEYVSHAALYSKVEKKYKTNLLKLEEYLYNLEDDSKLYFALRNSKVDLLDKLSVVTRNDKNVVRNVLEFLSFLGVDQVYSPVLHFYKNKDTKEFKKFLIRLSAFQFLYKYIPGSPSSAEKIFANMCNIKKNNDTEDLFRKLEDLVVNQEKNFKDKFIEKAKYREGNSGDIQFILERYILSKKGPKSFKEPTIEHIISRSKEKLNQIGNLTIFEKSINSKLPEDFKSKTPFYVESKYSEHGEIIEKYNFEKNYIKCIDRRGEDIAEEVYVIFINMLKTGKYE